MLLVLLLLAVCLVNINAFMMHPYRPASCCSHFRFFGKATTTHQSLISPQKKDTIKETAATQGTDDMWNHGEVAWDIADDEDEDDDDTVPDDEVLSPFYDDFSSTKRMPDSREYSSNLNDNSIYIKYFKNRIYFRVKKMAVRATYAALFKGLVRDALSVSNLAIDVQQLASSKNGDVNAETDLALLLIASGINLLEKTQSDNSSLSGSTKKKNKSTSSVDNKTLAKRVRRCTNIVFGTLSAVFVRNIKPVD
jgi:hypothetical protein